MTPEDKRLIAEYMGWKLSEWRMIDGSAHVVNPHFFDLNDAALCVQEMQKRGDWSYFYDDLLDTYNGLCEDCKEPCGADNFTAWLFNADNFFTAMAAWIKEEEK
jgi:hypothetical protein